MIKKASTVTIAVVALLVIISGCSAVADQPAPNGVDVNNPDQAYSKLVKLPSIDEAVKSYEAMGVKIRKELTSSIPELKSWKNAQDGVGTAGCLNGDGQTQNLSSYIVTKKLTDDQFEKALQIVGKVAARYGFDPTPKRFHDAPGNHDTSFNNPSDHSELTFGTDKTTLMGISIGCHLTADAKKRGHPSQS
jgi:hypothetical protein